MQPYFEISLPEAFRKKWQKEADKLTVNQNDLHNNLIKKAIFFSQNYLTDEIKYQLQNLKSPKGPPFLVIHNMPIDHTLPSPPKDGKRPGSKRAWTSELSLLALANAAGLHPLSYIQEKGNTLIHEIAPIPGKEKTLSNSGSVPLGFHTDDAILKREYRPEYLMLLGLVNEKEVATYIATLDKLLKRLPLKYIKLLSEPHFRIEAPESFDLWNGKIIQSELRPLLTRDKHGEYEIAGNLYAVKTKHYQARDALNTLINHLPDIKQKVVLAPGDVLIFNNHRCLHARDSVTGIRWLQRIFCRESLSSIHNATSCNSNSYIFDISHLVLE